MYYQFLMIFPLGVSGTKAQQWLFLVKFDIGVVKVAHFPLLFFA
jgi:hypothetical protein